MCKELEKEEEEEDDDNDDDEEEEEVALNSEMLCNSNLFL